MPAWAAHENSPARASARWYGFDGWRDSSADALTGCDTQRHNLPVSPIHPFSPRSVPVRDTHPDDVTAAAACSGYETPSVQNDSSLHSSTDWIHVKRKRGQQNFRAARHHADGHPLPSATTAFRAAVRGQKCPCPLCDCCYCQVHTPARVPCRSLAISRKAHSRRDDAEKRRDLQTNRASDRWCLHRPLCWSRVLPHLLLRPL